MNQRELIIRVLATMLTDLIAKEFMLDGMLEELSTIDDYELAHWVDCVGVSLSDAHENLDNIIARMLSNNDTHN